MTLLRPKFFLDCDINVFAIEGLDRLGKSTLIHNIKNRVGFYQVIHFSKPEVLEIHHLNLFDEKPDSPGNLIAKRDALFTYQCGSFHNSMLIAKSGARVIFDRWHLGECVYAPMYRKYDGEYVFNYERQHDMGSAKNIRLILLTEDFSVSNHFQDDGLSLGSASRENRMAEQQRFISAFNKSIISDKKIICVTDPVTGKFRSQEDILFEAVS